MGSVTESLASVAMSLELVAASTRRPRRPPWCGSPSADGAGRRVSTAGGGTRRRGDRTAGRRAPPGRCAACRERRRSTGATRPPTARPAATPGTTETQLSSGDNAVSTDGRDESTDGRDASE